MSCAVGVAHKGVVYLGSDSAASAGTLLETPAVQKVVRNGDLLIGCAGSFRTLNLVTHTLKLPVCDPGADPERWLVNVFVESLRRCLTAAGNIKRDSNNETMDCNMVVGFRGSVYAVDSDFLIMRSRCGYAAVGSGTESALGSLYSTAGKPPRKRIQLALEAAEQFTTNVRRPFMVKRIK